MKRLLFLIPVLALAGLIAVFGIGLTKDPKILPSMMIDRPLPPFTLAGLDAASPGLSHRQFRGEPKLINFFASWCVSCRVEHPMLERLAAEGVPIYGIDWKDEPAKGAAYLAQFGNPFRAVGSDPNGRTGIDMGVSGSPETFFVDARGRVRYRHVGPITPEVWAETLKPIWDGLRAEAKA
ncbi:DsbE family thiol:disulfide interchange protein [Sandaracinobacteroides saxicola]|uniref:DsbE family thiol:disulfide interchange protein n=1 Tax=Sandaracinobacteroides saxicola TaxID=2759707 RepID=A0A7G5IEZ6_9SPHN|nr:DsbE family thiol:disulfide interchange protein [Sandaracinobacteroides saxicola]QMW21938.1 DsbE family thiol:disulfide interchange protein [Sandaracinobacteroides saxicola]